MYFSSSSSSWSVFNFQNNLSLLHLWALIVHDQTILGKFISFFFYGDHELNLYNFVFILSLNVSPLIHVSFCYAHFFDSVVP